MRTTVISLPRSSTTIAFVKFTSNVFEVQCLPIRWILRNNAEALPSTDKSDGSIKRRFCTQFLLFHALVDLPRVIKHANLNSIPFLARRCLLCLQLTLGQLVHPRLVDILHPWYISPEAMVTCSSHESHYHLRVLNHSIFVRSHPPSP